jgi:hypothetical protein
MARKKAKLSKPTTPKRLRPPLSKIVGSSCTWRKDQLQELNVSYEHPEVEAKSLFDEPERWFRFDDLKHYEKGI